MKPLDFGGLRKACASVVAQFAEITEAMAPLREALRRADWSSFLEALRRVDLASLEESMRRQRAARADPDNPKSRPWIETGWMTLAERAPFERYLPDPTKRRGRPGGRGPVATDEETLLEMKRLVDGGMKRFTAARQLTDSPGAARHLVRVFNERF